MKARKILAMVLTITMMLTLIPVFGLTVSAASIPSDAKTFGGHSYAVYDLTSTWKEAEAYCEGLGGHLATITSREENDYLYNLVVANGYRNAYFGLTDENKEGTWQWVTGEPVTYTNWHSNEPNGYSSENYAMFYWKWEDGTWNDGDFGKETDNGGTVFICEWDSIATSAPAGANLIAVPLKAGSSIQLEPAVKTNVKKTWSSSKPNVAKVTSSGKVTAVSKGDTVITLKYGKIAQAIIVRVK